MTEVAAFILAELLFYFVFPFVFTFGFFWISCSILAEFDILKVDREELQLKSVLRRLQITPGKR